MHKSFVSAFTGPVRARLVGAGLLAASLILGPTVTAQPQSGSGQVEPRAGQWRTWVLSAGSDLRLPPPPDAADTQAELAELRRLAGQRDAAGLERIRHWDFWSPSYRWNEVLIDISAANPIPGGSGIRAFALLNVAIEDALVAAWDSKYAHSRRRPGETDGQPGLLFRLSQEVGVRLGETGLAGSAPRDARAYALVHVAHYEGWIASQDSKFHHWTARPNQFDPTITTVVPTPPFPTYPSNAATLASASTTVLGYLFPGEAPSYAGWAREFGESRLWAGIHFRSDVDSGWEIGRRVGEAVIERARRDGAQ
jgi:membrane-associated phospholipid phosphatase